MKIFTRFFIFFFLFALFFSGVTYFAQTTIFEHEQNSEEIKINQQVKDIKSYTNVYDKNLKQYLNEAKLQLNIVYYNEQDKKVHHDQLGTKIMDNTEIMNRFLKKSELSKFCQNTDHISREKPRNLEGDYLIQIFCHNKTIYILSSPYIQYQPAINLLQKSYYLILVSTVIISSILSLILARYFSLPLRNMSAVTQQITKLDFSRKVDFKRNDEIGDLGRNINILSDRLQDAISKLRNSVIIEKESRERQNQLFASMSHELKTPITILKGTLEGIKDEKGDYKDPLNHVDDMIEEVNMMESIVLNLLNYAKFSVQDIKLNLQEYSLKKLLFDEIDRLEFLIDEKDIQLEEQISDAEVLVDVPSIKMVVKNVLENAMYYSDPKARIEIFSSSFSDHVLIQIINHGKNIAPESIQHLFEPFYREENSRLSYKNGTGLGLTIVKQILEKHHSNFSLYNINDEDEYAVCFEFTLKKAKKEQ